MEQPKEYYAFISYKREDKREARRLQHALEYYRLPNHLRQENPELPEYVRPVFRDMTDLEVGELSAQIHAGLEQSHFLIVVCSPRAAASKWVNDEVEYFISLGKQNKIIPYIIEGVPHASNPDEECYPPSLLNLSKGKELLGANINEVGKDSATIRVVSRMFNIRFDTLYQRYEREQRRKRRMWIGGSIFIALLGLSIGGYFVRQNGIIERQKERLQQDSITMANHLLQISAQNDSIAQQNNLILCQRDSIEHSIQQLQLSNRLLAEERDNVRSANYSMQVNLSRVLAEKSLSLVDEGDSYLARKIVLHALPPNLPYTPEAEFALRKSLIFNSLTLRGHSDDVNDLCISPDGNSVVSASNDKTIKIWDLNNGNLLKTLEGHSSCITSVSFSPNGKKIVSSSLDKTIKIWDVETGENIKTIAKDTSFVNSVAYSPNGKFLLSVSDDYKTRIWDSQTGNLYSVINGRIAKVCSSSFSPDSRKVLCATKDTIKIYDIKLKKVTKKIVGHKMAVQSAVFSPDGKQILSSSFEDKIAIWDVGKLRKIKEYDAFVCYPNCSAPAVFSNDGSMFAYSNKNEIVVRDTKSGNIIRTHMSHKDKVTSLMFSPDGEKIVSASFDHTVKMWNVKGDTPVLYTWKAHKSWINSMSISRNGTLLASTSNDKTVIIWDISTRKAKTIISKHKDWTREVAFAPNNKYIISTSDDHTLKMFDIVKNKEIYSWDAKDAWFESATFSPSGKRIIATTSDSILKIYDVLSGEEIESLPGYYFNSIEYSPNEKLLVTPMLDFSVNVWNVKEKKVLNKLTGHTGYVYSAKFSPDGNIIATHSYDKTIKLWDTKTGRILKTLRGHRGAVFSLAFDHGGNRIVSGDNDGVIKIWDVRTGSLLQEYMVHSGAISSVYFTKDDESIISASWDLTIKVISCPKLKTLQDNIRNQFKDCLLTPEEKRKCYLE